jgi:hypothetical protein
MTDLDDEQLEALDRRIKAALGPHWALQDIGDDEPDLWAFSERGDDAPIPIHELDEIERRRLGGALAGGPSVNSEHWRLACRQPHLPADPHDDALLLQRPQSPADGRPGALQHLRSDPGIAHDLAVCAHIPGPL